MTTKRVLLCLSKWPSIPIVSHHIQTSEKELEDQQQRHRFNVITMRLKRQSFVILIQLVSSSHCNVAYSQPMRKKKLKVETALFVIPLHTYHFSYTSLEVFGAEVLQATNYI